MLWDFRDLPRTQPVEYCEFRHNLGTEPVVFGIELLESFDQRGIFRPEGFFECFNFIGQLID